VLYRQGITENSHLLNTLLIKLCVALFGVSELVLRLPALAGQLLFLAAVYKILTRFFDRAFLLPGIVLLAFQPFLLDLFSAARGYSLALGFMLWGVYFLLRQLERPPAAACGWDRGCRSLVMMALAALSHFSFIYVFAADWCLLTGRAVLGRRPLARKAPVSGGTAGNVRKAVLCYLLVAVVLAGICAAPMHSFFQHKERSFWEGGNKGFMADTVVSLLLDSLFGRDYAFPFWFFFLKYLVLGAFWVGVALTAGYFLRKKRGGGIGQALPGVTALLGLIVGMFLLNWMVLGIRYASGRTAVFLVPLWTVLLLLLLQEIVRSRRPLARRAARGALVLLSVLALAHFGACANTWYSFICPYDASTRNMMLALKAEGGSRPRPDNSVSLGVDWIFQQSANFYRETLGLTWLKKVRLHDLDQEHDYYLLTTNARIIRRFALEDDLVDVRKRPVRVLKVSRATGSVLLAGVPGAAGGSPPPGLNPGR
jgi:uncharacterized membrane protein